MRYFPLAPMSPLIWWVTAALLSLPGFLIVGGPMLGEPLLPMAMLGGAMALLCLAVWVWWRPTGFELAPGRLGIRFPARRRDLPLPPGARCRQISSRAFHQEYGWAVRVGVGGLWGGFGLIWTSRGGWVELYVSRTDGLVLVERPNARPLLITPEQPGAMVQAIAADA